MSLPFRQIHLDFHTSEAISEVGADFDPQVFADTLAAANVNSINMFARCHHGWVYYDSPGFPEAVHPHLVRRNLIAEQIEACHDRGIKTPLYVTVQWDYRLTSEHPEWCVMDSEGKTRQYPYWPGFYTNLCLNSPYVDWLKRFVDDMIAALPAFDGFWFDIVFPNNCSCCYCRNEMLARGLDPSDAATRDRFGVEVVSRFRRTMTEHVRGKTADGLIFYNAGHVDHQVRDSADAFTHMELESLPSGGWGYMHFATSMRYARKFGLDCIGMTGKFHTTWGDFHSFKPQAALEYECFRMLALGAMCCIGDQLLPHGKLCPVTYDRIGRVYRAVAAREPWCVDAVPVTEIAVLTPEAFAKDLRRHHRDNKAITGVSRMLIEGGHQFDIVDGRDDLTPYALVILPDEIPIDKELAAKLDAYIAQGGKVIASFASGMDDERTAFTWAALGVELTGEGPRDEEGNLVRGRELGQGRYIEYLLPRPGFDVAMPATEHVMYLTGMAVAATGGEVLADIVPPHFDRNWRHFCSHRQAPSKGQPSAPAVVQNGSVIYFSSPICRSYQVNGARWCKALLLAAVDRLLPQPLVRHDGPSTLEVTLNRQLAQQRQVLHLLHYCAIRNNDTLDIIDDVIPLHDLSLSVRAADVDSVRLVPDGQELAFTAADGRVSFTVPRVNGHQMVELAEP